MTSVQTRTVSTSVSPPEAATRPLLDLVSRFTNRLEDGDRPGHKLISAGLAPRGAERAMLENRKQYLLTSLTPPGSEDDRRALAKIIAALLGAFPTYGADREDAKATVGLICRALDDVPLWAVQRAAGHFLKGSTKTRWNPDRAPTPPQIRAEAKLLVLDVESELHRLGQVLDAELVDNDTTEDERRAAVAAWDQIKAGMGRTNVLHERTDEEIALERSEQRRANDRFRQRDDRTKRRLQAEIDAALQSGGEPFEGVERTA
ncbi:hypothetical protein ABID82_002270 [Methylobacterium sp. PvP062]|uniref:Uncharacterized protein n=1 Tax=Methylobacterium radiotolerans TaxID=31998 RepID=A0ABV2NN00_9HYPH|nr:MULTISPECIES: hypothetical protein [unclassified Methylobacterium]MBP2495397.1 hypothetical protein [Methylobacterium sp. PvP105]MBP2504732.1 hypothetical protein [Methylobacterium sp. PvP109]MCX7335743.1 hypothetical protein [Hyphomicrobiales bacterium]